MSASTPTPIYGKNSEPVGLTEEQQQIVVGVLTILIFVFMALEWFTPEVLLLSALIITLLLQILTLPDALSGMHSVINQPSFMCTVLYEFSYFRVF